MNVETILRNKGSWVATIRPDATIADAVDMLNKERIGALIVSEDGASVDGVPDPVGLHRRLDHVHQIAAAQQCPPFRADFRRQPRGQLVARARQPVLAR